MTKPKLEPCPFCNGEAEFEETVTQKTIRCKKCYAKMAMNSNYHDWVIENRWNKRVLPNQPKETPSDEILCPTCNKVMKWGMAYAFCEDCYNKKETPSNEPVIAWWQHEMRNLQSQLEDYRKALERIEAWETPYKGFEWDQGSRGQSEYIRSIARSALEKSAMSKEESRNE